jgi:hypothetical protein
MMRNPTSTCARYSRSAVLVFITCVSISACGGETPIEPDPQLRPQTTSIVLTGGNRDGGDGGTNSAPPSGTEGAEPLGEAPDGTVIESDG